jgi:hypothetical protein
VADERHGPVPVFKGSLPEGRVSWRSGDVNRPAKGFSRFPKVELIGMKSESRAG